MSFRRQVPVDSLNMLLDTMCNAFGGIVLIAVLLAVLTNHQNESASQAATDSSEILQRRISMAETNLATAMQEHTMLLASTKDAQLQERLRLLQEQRRLQTLLNEAQQEADGKPVNLPPAETSNPVERLKQIKSEMGMVAASKVDQENALRTAEENVTRLKARLEDLARQIAKIQDVAVQKLRLPKERSTSKDVFNIIIQYGRVYPLRFPKTGINERTIDWTFANDNAIPRPKLGMGYDPVRDAAALNTLFHQLDRNSDYIAYYVFDDSFSAFGKMKQATLDAGLDYGWKPVKTTGPTLIFGSNGTSPKVQ